MTSEISFKEHVFSMLYGCISSKASILLIAIKLSVHKCIYSFLQALGYNLFVQICHLETFYVFIDFDCICVHIGTHLQPCIGGREKHVISIPFFYHMDSWGETKFIRLGRTHL